MSQAPPAHLSAQQRTARHARRHALDDARAAGRSRSRIHGKAGTAVMRTVGRLHVQVHDVLRVQEVQPPRHIQRYLLAQARLSLPVRISAPAVGIVPSRSANECRQMCSFCREAVLPHGQH